MFRLRNTTYITRGAILTLALTALLAGGATGDGKHPCLIHVHINPEARVKAEQGAIQPTLCQGVWQSFRVRFDNEAKVTAVPRVHSPNAPSGKDRNRWLEMRLEPLNKPLTGKGVEYRTLWLRSRDSGKREATFTFDVGQGTQDLGFRGAVAILFPCLPGGKEGR